MKIVAIVQARTNSSRLPEKVLKLIEGKPMIIYQLERLIHCKYINELVVATSHEAIDNQLANVISEAGFNVFRGELEDVLERYRKCASVYKATSVVRLTGDCPFSDPELVDELIKEFMNRDYDYLANSADETRLSVPDGFDAEIFKADILERAAHNAKLPSEREHVTPWMRSKDAGLKWGHFCHDPIRPYYRLTVDDPIDLEIVREIANAIGGENKNFGVDEIVQYLRKNPELAKKNLSTPRNMGYLKSLKNDVELEKSDQ